MVMSWIWLALILVATICAAITGRGNELAAATVDGAQKAVTLALSMTGSLCLWSGVGELMEAVGITSMLSKLLRPLLHRIFPGSKSDPRLANALSGNICANILGLGNAATPMGILAAKRMVSKTSPDVATNELCRLVVLNTASIQLIPANVAAIRLSSGCQTPFDILPAVWVTSICAAAVGLGAAWILGKVWKDA